MRRLRTARDQQAARRVDEQVRPRPGLRRKVLPGDRRRGHRRPGGALRLAAVRLLGAARSGASTAKLLQRLLAPLPQRGLRLVVQDQLPRRRLRHHPPGRRHGRGRLRHGICQGPGAGRARRPDHLQRPATSRCRRWKRPSRAPRSNRPPRRDLRPGGHRRPSSAAKCRSGCA